MMYPQVAGDNLDRQMYSLIAVCILAYLDATSSHRHTYPHMFVLGRSKISPTAHPPLLVLGGPLQAENTLPFAAASTLPPKGAGPFFFSELLHGKVLPELIASAVCRFL